MARAQSLSPLLLGCGVVSFALTQLLVEWAPAVHVPWLPPPEARYLVPYAFVLPGMALVGMESLRRPLWRHAALDSLITIAAVAPFLWFFILGPLAVGPAWTMATKITYGAYPVCGLALIFFVLLSTAQWRSSSLRRASSALLLALISIAAADAAFSYGFLHHRAVSASTIDPIRILAYTLLGLAVSMAPLGSTVSSTAREPGSSPGLLPLRSLGTRDVWRYLLPYALIPAVVVLVAYAAHSSTDSTIASGVYLAAAVLVELVVVHQFLAYRELISYANRSARLESLAGADPVTGLLNHRSLNVTIDQELARSHRYARSCALLFLDLDHFKALNDTFGHRAGDAVLHEFGAVVRTALRGTDTLGRWGGEEFCVLLPETELNTALDVAERVRCTVARHSFWGAGSAHVTCSIGLAAFPHDAADRDSLIELADRAMYAAKHLGRNQVRRAGDPALALAEAKTRRVGTGDGAALVGLVEALAALAEARDHRTGHHVEIVAKLAVRLALALGLDTSEAHLIGLAGRLHDIGKVSIPDAVLLKPSSLTADEWELIRTHPGIGASVVSRVPALRPIAPIIRGHHEWWDGRGYPDGLEGEAIPLAARILAVADAFSAVTMDRPYRRAQSVDAATLELRRGVGTQFDRRVVDALEQVLAEDAMLHRTDGIA